MGYMSKKWMTGAHFSERMIYCLKKNPIINVKFEYVEYHAVDLITQQQDVQLLQGKNSVIAPKMLQERVLVTP